MEFARRRLGIHNENSAIPRGFPGRKEVGLKTSSLPSPVKEGGRLGWLVQSPQPWRPTSTAEPGSGKAAKESPVGADRRREQKHNTTELQEDKNSRGKCTVRRYADVGVADDRAIVVATVVITGDPS